MFLRLALILICALCMSVFITVGQEDSASEADSAPRPLKVWLPAPLIPDESATAFLLLSEHTETFSLNNNIAVEYRLKDIGSVGGIMSSIRSASEVAPGALPDITLIRRRDFTPTQARQYLQSMESLFSSSLINDLDNALEFGQIPLEGGVALYGLPYFFEVLHAVHTQPIAELGSRLSFDDVLANEATMLFPAARTSGLNQTFYLQYLAAGGTAPGNGAMVIDEDALLAVLSFYEALVNRGLVSADVPTYQTPAAYQSVFLNSAEQLQIAIFSSSTYLSMLEQQERQLYAANIPTANGNSLATRDGWLWVIVTPDLARQTYSARFLEWMTDPAFHAAFAKALHQLPSQPAILHDSLPENVDHAFFEALLYSGVLPLPESEGGTAPRIMQEALIQVLHDETTAASATQHVMNQLGDR